MSSANRIREAGDGVLLSVGAVADGEYLMRSGTSIVGDAGGGGGGGAPTSAQYVVVALNATLTNERRLQVGTGLQLTDAGANADITIAPANDLGAVEGLTGTGLAARTAAETWALRTLTSADAVLLAISNPAGVAGNPTFTLDSLEIVNRWVHPCFGDASDGDVTLAVDTTLTRDMQYDTLDLAGYDLNAAGNRIRCRELRNTGGGACYIGTPGNSTTTRFGANTTATGSLGQGSAGGNGGNNTLNGVAGTARTNSYAATIVGGTASDGGAAGASGGGNTGGAGGGAGSYTLSTNGVGGSGWMLDGLLASALVVQGGGGGGGGGSTGSGNGGGGGGGGGVTMVWAHTLHSSITSAVVVDARGGSGGDGTSTGGTGHGGGGGGGGGYARLVYAVSNAASLPTVTAAGGAGGTAAGTGVAGTDGEDGLAETVRLGV